MSRSAGKRVIVKESTGRKIIEQSRIRLWCVALFFFLCFISISVRMVGVAIAGKPLSLTISVTNPDDEDEVDEVELSATEPQLERGNIVDRNGMLLATSLMTASVFVNPREMKNREEAAVKLSRTLDMNRDTLMKHFNSKKTFVWIKRNLTPREQQAVNSLGIPGLYFLPEEKRVYPYGKMFAHLIGYVGIDNKGLAGAEKEFDSRLRDKALNYDPLELSVDIRLQAIMHEEMKKAMQRFQAIGAMGMILDLRNDEILSMVSLPDFNPLEPGKASGDARFNRVTQGVYEMGSTFKTFTMAMGLDAGTTTMKSSYNTVDQFKVSSHVIHDDHPAKHWLTLPEIYAYSSNIGTARIALEAGTERQKDFLHKLGMMKQMDIELPEKSNTLYPADWREINTVTISYGHGISISPLHLVRGIAALVNGGTLPRLTLLKDGNRGRPEGDRVIKKETSDHVRRLMRLVVEYGTGGKADVEGYRVGGKTGTAEKISASGHYDGSAKIASFIGIFPVDDPRYIVLVMVDEPKGDRKTFNFATGGWIAAPVVGRVIARMGPILGIRPQYDVPGDDAKKFWVENEQNKSQPSTAVDKRYIHAATY